MHRRTVILGALDLALASTRSSSAGEVATFDRTAFAAVQEAGKPIVAFVHAPW